MIASPRESSRNTSREPVRFPAPNEVHVWFADIDHGSDADRVVLSADERTRADRFHFARDRDRFTAARATLRRLLADYLGDPPSRYQFGYTPQGKPFLAGGFAARGLEFNVSHSQGCAAYAFTAGRPVGVDVEILKNVPDAEQIAQRFFAPAEAAELGKVSAAHKNRAFLNAWTRKEAVIKALGQGLGFPLDRFEVSLGPGEPARLLALADGDPGEWTLAGFEPEEGFLGAVAVQAKGHEVTLCGSWNPETSSGRSIEVTA